MAQTRSESSVTPFLVAHRKVWLTHTAQLPCSNGANIGECKTWMQSDFCIWKNSIRGQEPPKMYIWCASAGNGQTSCKVWLACDERRRCSNEAKTRNPLKLAGVPQTCRQISATSGPSSAYYEDMWRRYCCGTSLFLRLSMHALVVKI